MKGLHAVRKLLVIADGNGQIGLGHLKREADLINALGARSGWRAWLATRESSAEALGFFRSFVRADTEIVRLEQDQALPMLIEQVTPDLGVIDLLNGRFDACSATLAASRVLSLGVGDWSEPRPCGTALVLNANPCNLEAKRSLYAASGVTALLGPQYFMAAPELAGGAAAEEAPSRREGPVREILVALGGGDLTNVLGRVLEVIAPLARSRAIRLRVLPSPVSRFKEDNRARFEPTGVEFLQPVESIGPLLQGADLLVASHGNIAYESAILGVPMVAVNLIECQYEQAEEMERLGAVVNAGIGSALRSEAFRELLERVLDDVKLRRRMTERRRALVDGRGLERLIATLDERL